jgi:hypothetical protein
MNHQSTQALSQETRGEPMKTRLFRYGEVDGVRTLKDSQLEALFERAKKENVLHTVMYSDDVERWTSRTFIALFKNEARASWLVFYDGKLAGWVWLDDFGHRTARIHFCFFKWLGKNRLTVQVGRELLWQLLNMGFRGGTRLAAIRGETPSFNKLAVRFIQKVGLRIIGEMPSAAFRHQDGVIYPMVYSYITLDILKQQFESDAQQSSS